MSGRKASAREHPTFGATWAVPHSGNDFANIVASGGNWTGTVHLERSTSARYSRKKETAKLMGSRHSSARQRVVSGRLPMVTSNLAHTLIPEEVQEAVFGETAPGEGREADHTEVADRVVVRTEFSIQLPSEEWKKRQAFVEVKPKSPKAVVVAVEREDKSAQANLYVEPEAHVPAADDPRAESPGSEPEKLEADDAEEGEGEGEPVTTGFEEYFLMKQITEASQNLAKVIDQHTALDPQAEGPEAQAVEAMNEEDRPPPAPEEDAGVLAARTKQQVRNLGGHNRDMLKSLAEVGKWMVSKATYDPTLPDPEALPGFNREVHDVLARAYRTFIHFQELLLATDDEVEVAEEGMSVLDDRIEGMESLLICLIDDARTMQARQVRHDAVMKGAPGTLKALENVTKYQSDRAKALQDELERLGRSTRLEEMRLGKVIEGKDADLAKVEARLRERELELVGMQEDMLNSREASAAAIHEVTASQASASGEGAEVLRLEGLLAESTKEAHELRDKLTAQAAGARMRHAGDAERIQTLSQQVAGLEAKVIAAAGDLVAAELAAAARENALPLPTEIAAAPSLPAAAAQVEVPPPLPDMEDASTMTDPILFTDLHEGNGSDASNAGEVETGVVKASESAVQSHEELLPAPEVPDALAEPSEEGRRARASTVEFVDTADVDEWWTLREGAHERQQHLKAEQDERIAREVARGVRRGSDGEVEERVHVMVLCVVPETRWVVEEKVVERVVEKIVEVEKVVYRDVPARGKAGGQSAAPEPLPASIHVPRRSDGSAVDPDEEEEAVGADGRRHLKGRLVDPNEGDKRNSAVGYAERIMGMDVEDAVGEVQGLRSTDIRDILLCLPEGTAWELLTLLAPEDAAGALGCMAPDPAAVLVSKGEPEIAAEVLVAAAPHTRAAVLGAMTADSAEAICSMMEPDELASTLGRMKLTQALSLLAGMPEGAADMLLRALPHVESARLLSARGPQVAMRVLDGLAMEEVAGILSHTTPAFCEPLLAARGHSTAGVILAHMVAKGASREAREILAHLGIDYAIKTVGAVGAAAAATLVGCMKADQAASVMGFSGSDKLLDQMPQDSALRVRGVMNRQHAFLAQAAQNPDAATAALKAMDVSEASAAVARMDPAARTSLLLKLSAREGANVLHSLPGGVVNAAIDSVREADPEKAQAMQSAVIGRSGAWRLEGMEPDEAAEAVLRSPANRGARLLSQAPTELAVETLITMPIKDAARLLQLVKRELAAAMLEASRDLEWAGRVLELMEPTLAAATAAGMLRENGAQVMVHMSLQPCQLLISLMEPAVAAVLVAAMPREESVELLESMMPAKAAHVLDNMGKTAMAQALVSMNNVHCHAVMDELKPLTRQQAMSLMPSERRRALLGRMKRTVMSKLVLPAMQARQLEVARSVKKERVGEREEGEINEVGGEGGERGARPGGEGERDGSSPSALEVHAASSQDGAVAGAPIEDQDAPHPVEQEQTESVGQPGRRSPSPRQHGDVSPDGGARARRASSGTLGRGSTPRHVPVMVDVATQASDEVVPRARPAAEDPGAVLQMAGVSSDSFPSTPYGGLSLKRRASHGSARIGAGYVTLEDALAAHKPAVPAPELFDALAMEMEARADRVGAVFQGGQRALHRKDIAGLVREIYVAAPPLDVRFLQLMLAAPCWDGKMGEDDLRRSCQESRQAATLAAAIYERPLGSYPIDDPEVAGMAEVAAQCMSRAKELDFRFGNADVAGTGALEYGRVREVVEKMDAGLTPPSTRLLMAALRLADRDRDGSVSVREVRVVLEQFKDLAKEAVPPASLEELEARIAAERAAVEAEEAMALARQEQEAARKAQEEAVKKERGGGLGAASFWSGLKAKPLVKQKKPSAMMSAVEQARARAAGVLVGGGSGDENVREASGGEDRDLRSLSIGGGDPRVLSIGGDGTDVEPDGDGGGTRVRKQKARAGVVGRSKPAKDEEDEEDGGGGERDDSDGRPGVRHSSGRPRQSSPAAIKMLLTVGASEEEVAQLKEDLAGARAERDQLRAQVDELAPRARRRSLPRLSQGGGGDAAPAERPRRTTRHSASDIPMNPSLGSRHRSPRRTEAVPIRAAVGEPMGGTISRSSSHGTISRSSSQVVFPLEVAPEVVSKQISPGVKADADVKAGMEAGVELEVEAGMSVEMEAVGEGLVDAGVDAGVGVEVGVEVGAVAHTPGASRARPDNEPGSEAVLNRELKAKFEADAEAVPDSTMVPLDSVYRDDKLPPIKGSMPRSARPAPLPSKEIVPGTADLLRHLTEEDVELFKHEIERSDVGTLLGGSMEQLADTVVRGWCAEKAQYEELLHQVHGEVARLGDLAMRGGTAPTADLLRLVSTLEVQLGSWRRREASVKLPNIRGGGEGRKRPSSAALHRSKRRGGSDMSPAKERRPRPRTGAKLRHRTVEAVASLEEDPFLTIGSAPAAAAGGGEAGAPQQAPFGGVAEPSPRVQRMVMVTAPSRSAHMSGVGAGTQYAPGIPKPPPSFLPRPAPRRPAAKSAGRVRGPDPGRDQSSPERGGSPRAWSDGEMERDPSPPLLGPQFGLESFPSFAAHSKGVGGGQDIVGPGAGGKGSRKLSPRHRKMPMRGRPGR